MNKYFNLGNIEEENRDINIFIVKFKFSLK